MQQAQHQGESAVFRMDGKTVFLGALVVFSSIIFVVTTLPFLTFNPPRSADARPLTDQEERGRRLYASNGCNYCHSQYLRPQDWTGVASFRTVGRIAQAGDYYYLQTPMLGTERTGPDLSQEGGAHTDEWNLAHFYNPRWTSPKSIMPEFSFYFTTNDQGGITPNQDVIDLIAYVQSLGGNAGVERAQRQRALKAKLLSERAKGNEAIIHDWFPSTWRNVRNPMPPTVRSLTHGKQVFTTNCIGCHGVNGDGKGPAARLLSYPPLFQTSGAPTQSVNSANLGGPAPRNLTDASQQLYFSDGEMYDAILFGVDGTAMPAFGDILTVNDIWDLTNFIRTIPNGGLQRDPDPSMMISPADVKPIEATPLPLGPAPGNTGAVAPTKTPGAAPTSESQSGAGAGAKPTEGAAPATTVPGAPGATTPSTNP
jgi:cytochrome c oxidase cbb3-type subunit II